MGKLSLVAILLSGVLSSIVIAGFGGGGFLGHAPQSYDLTITATSGQAKHVATITLNIE